LNDDGNTCEKECDAKGNAEPTIFPIIGARSYDRYEGSVRDGGGRDYLFRLERFAQGDELSGYSLLLAAEDDFAQNVRKLQIRGPAIALIASGCFVPAVWMFGGRMSTSLKQITAQAIRLRTLAAPDDKAVTSHVAEIDELGRTMAVAHRSIWSFEG
jgi:adenylate cyclase